jgi:hypothetical protein
MGLLDDLKNEENFVESRRAWCATCTLLESLKPEERKLLTIKMEDKSVSHTAISKVLTANGYKLASGTIGRHRRGECQRVPKK